MHGLAPTRQQRSTRTLEAILEAAEALLSEGNPAEVTLAAICRRAGLTTGAFYGRFRDRGVLFRVLEQRVYEAFEERLEVVLDPAAPGGLEGTVRRVVEATANLYRKHRGTLRALSIFAMSDPELAGRAAAFNRDLIGRVVARITAYGDEIAHRDPRGAASDIVVWVVTILRQQILFGELGLQGVRTEPDRLVQLAFVYLTSSRSQE